MGVLTPSLTQLCAHQLTGRDAAGLAEDYLAAIGWPVAPEKSTSGRREQSSKRLLADLRAATPHPPRAVDRN